MSVPVTDWQPRAAALAEQVTTTGAWREAFAAVPRHVFVPAFHDRGELVTTDTDRERWLTGVYSNESLVTQIHHAHGVDWPTSSSTLPSLMARMLELLDVHDGHSVIEIGTGTGFNAALLCHRLGDQNVTSVDIDASLVEAARGRLASLGYRPTLAAVDGAGPLPVDKPVDRLIATAAMTRVPASWITAVAPGGVIVADIYGGVSSHLIVLHTNGDTATGQFLATPGWFMPLRARPDNPFATGNDLAPVDMSDPQESRTHVDLALLTEQAVLLLAQFLDPGLTSIYHSNGAWNLSHTDGSQTHVTAPAGPDGHLVTRYGPRPIWNTIEHAIELWRSAGEPDVERLGLTVRTDDTHAVWADQPDKVITTR